MANLKKNPAVELNIVDPLVRKGYRFKGTGKAIVEGELFEEIMRFYQGRWVDTAKNKESRTRGFVLAIVETALPLISLPTTTVPPMSCLSGNIGFPILQG